MKLYSPNDWNLVTRDQIINHGGRNLFKKYSLYDIKCLGCPDGKLIFNKPAKPSGYWENNENIQNFMKEIKEKLNLNSPEDWNLLSYQQIKDHGGSSLLGKYSLYNLKCIGCPEGKNLFTKSIPHKPKGYWDNKSNVKQFLNEVKEKLNLNTIEDWNSLTCEQISSFHGGDRLLRKYSLFKLKSIGFPEGTEFFDKPIQSKNPGYWKDESNIIKFINELKINLTSIEDWKKLSNKDIKKLGGRGLLDNFTLYEIKCLGCPDGKLIFNKPSKPSKYWDNIDNIQNFMKEIKEKLNLNSPEDWNLLSYQQIKDHGGSSLLGKYSLYNLKCIGCPDGQFLFKKPLESKPNTFWDDHSNIQQFLNNLQKNLNLNTLEDWNRVSVNQIILHGGSGLISKFSLREIIQFQFPDVNFDLNKKDFSKRTSQRWLFLQVQKLFPDEEIVEDYFHPEISRETGFAVQFDIFLVNKNIAIEYHGKHHYIDIPEGFAPLHVYQNRDKEKENICKRYDIQLIIIPYWWDNTLDSLRVTLDKFGIC